MPIPFSKAYLLEDSSLTSSKVILERACIKHLKSTLSPAGEAALILVEIDVEDFVTGALHAINLLLCGVLGFWGDRKSVV